MAEQFMAHFGPSYIETEHFGENNAITYKLEASGSNFDSSTNKIPYVKINGGASMFPSSGRGINAITISPTGVASNYASFDIYGRPEHLDTLKTYLQSSPSNNIIVLASYDAIRSSDDFDTLMRQYGAVSWPGAPYLNKANSPTLRTHRSSYVAVFNTTLKRFCYENFVGNDATATTDTSAYLKVVFDIVADIGACGLPMKKVDDITEYFSSGTQYVFKSYFIEPITQWETIFHLKADLHRDSVLEAAGGYSRIYLYTSNSSGQWLSQLALSNNSSPAGEWVTVEGYFKLPAQAAGSVTWGCNAYRYPSSVTTGVAGVRNVTVTQINRDSDDKIVNAAIGVNGIRANSIGDNADYANPVMQLLNLKPNNVLTSNDFRER